MSRIKDLIRKLWEGNLSANESRELDELINHNDADFKQELEKQFYAAIAEEKQEKEVTRKADVFSIRRYSWQVAASLIFALLLIEVFFPPHSSFTDEPRIADGKVTVTAAPAWVHKRNNTAIDMHISLSDGSVVMLSPGSSMRYKKLFEPNKRDVFLTGKAYFAVEKNPAKPFSVHTGEFITTALGTSFEVNTFYAHKLVVRLFTGKVKVYAPAYNDSFDAVFLTPKQQVLINLANRTAIVRSEFKAAERQLVKKEIPLEKSSNIHFENAPLADVFNKLSDVYQIPIEYKPEQIEGLYFTGSVLETDSIKNIITLIANMNGLVATQIDNHFVIQKK